LEGAIRSVGRPPWTKWGHDSDPPPKPNAVQEKLAAVINQPSADLVSRASDGDPIVAPPIYGRWHAARKKAFLRAGDSTDVTKPLSDFWLDQLNLDPRHRTAAGLGARVAGDQQEAFMAAAWRQVGAVEKANQ